MKSDTFVDKIVVETHPRYLPETYDKPFETGLFDKYADPSKTGSFFQKPQKFNDEKSEWPAYLTHFLAVSE